MWIRVNSTNTNKSFKKYSPRNYVHSPPRNMHFFAMDIRRKKLLGFHRTNSFGIKFWYIIKTIICDKIHKPLFDNHVHSRFIQHTNNKPLIEAAGAKNHEWIIS